ncbi:SCO1 protein [Rickenella mellea]|uniref:SCO1 protein n=1 Tax=Rickenella mellea TaxID=50990 RepID=A0A4Y7PL05_9AGAM|nr:SCO1 protein [Rickenella mellea]
MNIIRLHRAPHSLRPHAFTPSRSLLFSRQISATRCTRVGRNTGKDASQSSNVVKSEDGQEVVEGSPNGPSKSTVEAKRRPLTQQTASGQRDRSAVGVFTPTAALLFIATGVGLYFYFQHEKAKILEAKRKEMLANKKIGRANVGGPFELTTHTGQPFTEKNLLGRWSLIYFGFTNCPDICPDELDKMGKVVDELDKLYGPISQPIFISVDPSRDPPPKIAHYLRDFHPRLVGLSGTYPQTQAICKAYRVYFSTPKDAVPEGDYLVDHSIYFYLMDPDGRFVEAFGKSSGVGDVVEKAVEEIGRWVEEKGGATKTSVGQVAVEAEKTT